MTNKEFTQYMKKYGANDALFRADNAEQTQMALAAGADVNSTNEDGWTPLTLAKTVEKAKLLIAAGADVNKFLCVYCKIPSSQLTVILTQRPGIAGPKHVIPELIKLLIEAGANVNAKENDGRTPLMCAADKGHSEIVKLLIENGADVNAKNNYGHTSLMCAAGKGHTEIVKLLIEKGANVNAKNNYGRTPLMYAADEGHTETVKLLIEKGADVNAKDKDGRTPLMCAADEGHTETEMLLRKHDAVSKRKFREESEQQKQDPVFRAKLAETKKALKEKQDKKSKTKDVSGVVVADKIAEMKRDGKIKGDVTPEMGKELSTQIKKEMMMAKAVKTTQR